METHELLPQGYYGGRPGQSAEDAMIILSESIHKAWKGKKGLQYSAIFLNVTCSFNNVHLNRLRHNLCNQNIPTIVDEWVHSYLQNPTALTSKTSFSISHTWQLRLKKSSHAAVDHQIGYQNCGKQEWIQKQIGAKNLPLLAPLQAPAANANASERWCNITRWNFANTGATVTN